MHGGGWLRRVGPWVGIGTSPAALMTGGGMGEGLRGGEMLLAPALGVTLLATLAIGQGILGQRTGRILSALTVGPLGEVGSRRTASVAMLLMMVGWFGVNAGVAGVAVARLAGVPDVAGVALFAAVTLVVARATPGLAAICAIHALRGTAACRGRGTTGLCCWGAGFGCGIALHVAGSRVALPAAALLPAVVYRVFGPGGRRNLADAKTGS